MKVNHSFVSKKLCLLLYLLTFLTSVNSLQAASYYFSSLSGDDSRTTSQAQNQATPWKSLSKLSSIFSSLVAGDSVLFKRGEVFTGSINVTKSGIVFSAYGTGTNPVISGFQDLTFTNTGANLWESNAVSVKPNIVLYNGNPQLPARYPNSGYLTLESNGGSNQFTDNQLSGNWAGGEVAVRKNNWVFDKGNITSQSGGTITYSNQTGDDHTTNWGYFIQNQASALDQQGEWYYNTTNQKLVFYSTTSPVNTKSSVIAKLVQLNNTSATFYGLDFEGSNEFTFYLSGSSATTISNCNINYSGSYAIYGTNSNNLKVDGCAINRTNNVAVLLNSSKNAVITNNNINTTGIEGQGWGLNVTSLEYSAISVSYSDGTLIQGNKIINSGYHGINYSSGSNYVIQYNYVDGYCSIKDDGGGIYTWNGSNTGVYTGVKIIGNIVRNGKSATATRNNPSYTPAHGIYMDDNAAFADIIGNTVFDCAGSGILLHNAHDMVIRNNVVYNCGGPTADPASVGQIQFLADNSGFLTRNIQLFGNQFASKFNYQLVLKWDTPFNDVSFFGSADSNYYARPIDDNLMARIIASGTNPFYNLAGWKTYSGKDANSKKSPKTVTSVDSLRFVYNENASPLVINLGGTFIDLKGNSYSGSITLPPYSSSLLIYKSGTLSNQPPVANAGTNQTITLPTNSVTLNGTASDPDGNSMTYQWTRITGPNNPTVANATSLQTNVTGLVQGTYSFVLTVTDNLGASAKDTVSITVNPGANQPPVANAGTNQTITLPTNSVTLNGTASDPDGNPMTYQWARIAGPNNPTVANTTSLQTNVTGLILGTYSFVLTVTDNLGASAKDTVSITVNAAPNQAPVANAGTNQTITLPTNSVTLNGTASDPDGNSMTYQWARIAGPNNPSIANTTSLQTNVTGLVQGTYSFVLTVTDNLGASAKDTVSITVNAAPNQAPVANAGTNQTITLPTNSVTLNGTASDPDGNPMTYQWTRITGPNNPTIANNTNLQTNVSGLVQGNYSFELTVTDNLGAAAKDTVFITVNAASNQPPTANAGNDQTVTLPANSVTLNGTASDPEGNPMTYQWTKISGPNNTIVVSNFSTLQPTVSNLVQGTYVFELLVTDNLGASARDTVTINVIPTPNQPPVVNAGANQTITLPTNNITLNGTATDPNGNTMTYRWTRITGPNNPSIANNTSLQTNVTGLVQGNYSFELRVTDNLGAAARDTVFVTVNAAPNQPPVANAGVNQTITLPVNSVTLNGTASDPDGNPITYQWARITGPNNPTIANATNLQTNVTGLVQGSYSFVLTVTDNLGVTARDTVVITVNAAPNQPPTANAGNNITITLPTNSVTLNGTANDPEGNSMTYQWTKISGPNNTIVVSNFSTLQPVISNLVQGIYTFELLVTDNLGASARDTVMVTVNPAANQPPVANAGNNITITLPTNSVTLNGTATDPNGNTMTYQWTRVTGPNNPTVANSTSLQTNVSGLVQGVYSFELRVTDSQGAIARDTVTVTVNPAVNNQPPVANAGEDQNITLPTDTTTLSGTAYDPDGNTLTYQWTKIAGPDNATIGNSTGLQTNVSGLAQGTYSFELRVTDSRGAVARDTVTVTVFDNLLASVKVFPNPTVSNLNISLPAIGSRNLITIKIYDQRGILVFSKQFRGDDFKNNLKISFSSFMNGVYFLEINAGITSKQTFKVMKQ